jgi:uncharacterized protein (TIGR03083 family)
MAGEPAIDLLRQTWDDVVALCGDLRDDQWKQPTDLPGWSVQDNIAHMIGTEMMLQGEQAPLADIGHAPYVRNDIGKFNEQWVVLYRNRSGADTLADFRRVTQRRLDALEQLPAEKWDEEGFTPEGPGPYRQFMEIRVFDCWFHDQDIREALDRPGFLDSPAADLSVGRIPPKGLPYIVGKKAGAPQGATVVFTVTGDTPLVASIRVDGRAALLPEVPDAPTTALTLDRRTFTRLAGGRWSGDQARARGSVEIAGDEDLGARIVDNFAFTI